MATSASSSGNSVLCKRCKSKVINGIKCQKCANYFHVSCAKLSGKFSADKTTVVCCETENVNMDTDSAFYDAMEEMASVDKRLDPRIFTYIIKQKDIIISELQEKIGLLNKQIDMLNSSVKPIREQNHNKAKKNDVDKVSQTVTKNNSETKTISNKKQRDVYVSENQVSADLMKIQTQLKCNEIINLAKMGQENNVSSGSNKIAPKDPNDEWQRVATKRNRKKEIIVGKNTSASIKGVPKFTSLHVYRVDVGTTETELRDLLVNTFPEATCEAITPKNPQLYSSFKVHIYEENFKKAMNPEVWPEGACVSRFFQLRRKMKPLD